MVVFEQPGALGQPSAQLPPDARDQRHDPALIALAVTDDQFPGSLRDPEVADLERRDLTDRNPVRSRTGELAITHGREPVARALDRAQLLQLERRRMSSSVVPSGSTTWRPCPATAPS